MKQASEINAILTEINYLDAGKLGKKQLDEVESLVLEYLKDNSTDIEMWYKLVLLNLNFFHDEESAIKHLRTIHELFKDDKSIILICFIHDEFWGGIEQEDDIALQEQIPADNRLQACREFYLAKFRKDKAIDEDFVKGLLRAVDHYNNYVHVYLELGHHFKDERADLKKAQTFFAKAIASVERELTVEGGKNDYLDINFYFKEMVFGLYCTTPKLEYIKSLSKD